ncbi:MAG: AMP-binding protein [Hyphomicrobiales bacterium]|nr:AMP-binding protein [Hyphomicrobiales bacterium]MDE2373670.1 AMP-binding protein [Hyphomicrobiales bacterium]
MTPLAELPKTRREIERLQSERKKRAVAQARRAPFFAGKLDRVDPDRLDDPDEWRKIPILDKETLRKLDDREFYDRFCLTPDDGVAEFWRSGGSTGTPLFYPRSYADIVAAMIGFARVYDCTGCRRGGRAHVSFPLGIHPVGQMLARAAAARGIAVNWAGSGTTTPSALQLELIDRLQPTIWMGMSSYGLHLANLAEARGLDLGARSIETVLCSAEPVSDAKRDKLGRHWGAQVRDTFGMTEAGMMGAEDAAGRGFRVWTDMFFIEVLDPETYAPVAEDAVGTLVVTPLWTNNITPFLRWSSGDLVTWHRGDDDSGPFSVFPLVKHAHRTSGFFKVRGININHADFEDFVFRNVDIGDFKAELATERDLDIMVVSIEVRRGVDPAAAVDRLKTAIRDKFGLTPNVVLMQNGSLAKEFEASVKMPRFTDRRQ